ncbi:CaiB/BaiF CoA transferase family protein [Limobrevibacterium gyesilva]|uniref:CoA transferase n=1 Tax=Limobrevibacterium gyesilva TaxID=2991712 RepID=A0AA41YTB0_9PROT|nr:CaiB/BaiF CoA-transferase family protein [Limobrevibacterium gyesilva]MCW3476080.1 CoA transferase [Limobrevibacterium gyesilva]
MSRQPLAGIKVIDFTQVMLGPCCTQVLGDYGADVIKIERAGAGDLSRSAIPDPAGLQNPVFCSLNRNKRSIALDLKAKAGLAIVHKLVATADVVVNNFRPGVMERMGVGYEALSAINPRIIYAVGTGYGTEGPYAHKGGQDILAQAITGVMARKCDPSEPTLIYPTALADYAAGMHLVQGILLALMQRQQSGRGQIVSVSLYDSMLAMQTQEASMWLMRDRDFSWGAMPYSGVFDTTDGAVVIVGAFKANPLRDICTALGLEDLTQDPRFSSFEHSVANREALHAILRARVATGTTARWIAALEALDLLCAPVRKLGEALDDPQTAINGMVLRAEAGETIGMVGSPVHMSDDGFALRHVPPQLGGDGEDILREHGFDGTAIAALKAEGVLA